MDKSFRFILCNKCIILVYKNREKSYCYKITMYKCIKYIKTYLITIYNHKN